MNPALSVLVADTKIAVGQHFSLSGSGFKAGETVDFFAFSTPTLVGTAVASADGKVSFTWLVPGDFEVGAHRLVAVGRVSGRTDFVPFTVKAADKVNTPSEKVPSKESTE
ncbi:hypothetical protein [Schaalia sp. Marseille-Q2122]|uniref:hypothetical protein n=1 Tax=Schaalia sp. Marseille-Q2122 TaxID=2736604 RepID=UPI00158E8E01|nr:hypothetical protein [Schaalia sp. Marseille-Q2122]